MLFSMSGEAEVVSRAPLVMISLYDVAGCRCLGCVNELSLRFVLFPGALVCWVVSAILQQHQNEIGCVQNCVEAGYGRCLVFCLVPCMGSPA